MKNYYFTFGYNGNQPFCGGWIIVKATSKEKAQKIFKKFCQVLLTKSLSQDYNCHH